MKTLSTIPTRPILRYHGGKWVLAPWIISYFPQHRVYVEPFGGAASVLLRKPRAYAEVYNDLDDDIVNLFQVARDNGAELQRLLSFTPFARSEYIRAWQPSDDATERARRTVIRSFMGFGGAAATMARATAETATGFRACSNRSGTTPAHDWRNFVVTGFRNYTGENDGRQNRRTLPAGDWGNHASCLEAIIERLRGVVIENRPAAQVMAAHDGKTTLHYVDPPYPKETRGNKRDDYRHEMTTEQHRELAAQLHNLLGYVVISGYPCTLYDEELYVGWHRVERKAMADGARERTEVLWLNPRAAAAQTGGHTRSLFDGGGDRMKTLAGDFGIIAPTEPGVYYVPCPACKPVPGLGPRLAALRRLRPEAKCLQVTISDPDNAWHGAKWHCEFCGVMGDLKHGILIDCDSRLAQKEWRDKPIEITPAAWDPNALARLLRRGISEAAIARCRVVFEHDVWIPMLEERHNAIALPYRQAGKLVAVKSIADRGVTSMRGTPSLFGIDDVTYANDDGSVVPQEIAYIVPDEMSKLAMETAGYPNTIALPWLPAKKEFGDYFSILDRADYKLVDEDDDTELGLIDRIETFYIAMDSTPAGTKLEDELVRRLGPERCVRVRWPKLPLPGEAKTLWDGRTVIQPGDTFKDANETLYCAGVAAIQQAIHDARPIPIDGVFRVEDFEADIWDYYFNGLPPGFALPRGKDGIGNAFVNKSGENCLAFQTRTTCVWTGIPGHGKSRMMENTTVELARSEDFKWVYFSPEVNPLQLFATYLMSQWAGVPFNKGYVDRMNEELTKAAIKWLHEHFFFLKAGLLPFSVQDLLDRATKLVRRYGVNGLVIDPWNNVYHSRKAFEREDEYIGQALQKINAWREQNNVLVHIVAHPGKFKLVDGKEPRLNLNDIKGGSEFFSMTDFGFTVWRDRGDENSNSEIHIQKSKFQHLVTMGVAQLKFDKPTSKFYDAGVPFGGVPTKQRNRGEQPLFEAPEYGTEDGAPPWLQGHEYDL